MSKKTKESQNTTQEVTVSMNEIATRDAAQYVAYLDYLPNPDPVLRTQGQNYKVYRDFVDGHLDSVMHKRISAVTSRPWSIEGKGDPAKSKLIEDWLFQKVGYHDVTGQMVGGAVGYGMQVHEVCWGLENGLILPMAIKDKPQEWFRFSDRDNQLVMRQKDGRPLELLPRKFLLTRQEPTYSNPYGKATLSRCFWPIAFKKGGLKFWMLWLEKFGFPKAIGKVPGGTSQTERDKFLRNLYGLIRDAVAVIPNTGSVELLETKQSGNGDGPHAAIVKWADEEMSIAWLGETLSTQQTTSGASQALGTVHNEVRQDLTMDDATRTEGTWNTLIRWIWELNWPDEKNIPWMNIQLPEDMQTARVDRDVKLYNMGVRFNSNYYVDTYGIDAKYIAKIIVDEPTSGTPASFAEATDKDEMQESPNAIADQFAEKCSDSCAKINLLGPLKEMIDKADTLEEVRDNLLSLFAEIPTEPIAKEMEEAFTTADLAGRYDILKKAGLVK